MRAIWRIVRFTKVLWRYYLGVSAMTVLLAVMSQLQPLFTKAAIDQATKLLHGGKANVAFVGVLAVLMFLTDWGQTLLSNVGGYWGDVLAAKLQRLLSERYYQHMLSLPQRYFDTELSGTIINRMNRGISQIATFVQTISNNFLQFVFSTIFSLLIVAYYSWQVAAMLFLIYPVFIWLTIRTSSRWQLYQHRINESQDKASGRFAEAIGQVRVVKSFLQEPRELDFFRGHYSDAVNTTYPQSRLWHRQDIIRRSVLNLIFLGVFAYIFIETARGAYSIGTMVLLIQYAMLIRIPVFTISFLVDQTQRAVTNTQDYFAAMDVEPEVADQPNARKLSIKHGAIAFEHVGFGYEKDKLVLRGVDFEIEPSTKIALVGESGEGKTTIVNLLLRLYDVSSGSILIDGQDIREVTQASLRSHIGVVFQEPALFSGTVKENISYARPKATMKEITAAARAANAHNFITEFENGYDSEIGERGLKLSGGQKQRIAIARAILKDAPILVLDEATSSLDSKSEHLVQQALRHLMKGRTTLIIAHRLSTIGGVDQIITLRAGRVDEVGPPEKLARSGGIYGQLLALQHAATTATQKQLKQYEING
ncbi:MAG TPA: ABC transporter ATP-binding protein [Candidatus Saccharimonadales bacterium]|nr:ABC transporter ATP-binding protein [Candidatus Saccharimonadales bacterium]